VLIHLFSGLVVTACIIQALFAQSLGETVYKRRCAACHEQTSPRIPHGDTLKNMSVARILRSLDFGAMMNVASVLRRDEREAVAAYLGTARPDSGPPSTAFCSDRAVMIPNPPKSAWNGWSPTAANTRFQSTYADTFQTHMRRRSHSLAHP
jgi:polyvinyl alcohol dehydrogenase (cytochrome)